MFLSNLLERVKSVCAEFGLVTHKDKSGADLAEGEKHPRSRPGRPRSRKQKLQSINQSIISLGIVVEVNELGEFYLRPRSDMPAALIAATQFILKKRVDTKCIERILGHWCWLLQLRRSFYSILFYVSHFILPFSDCSSRTHVFIPEAVYVEFQRLIDLAPLLDAKLTRPLGSRVYLEDAGPEMGAVIWARTDVVEGFAVFVRLASDQICLLIIEIYLLCISGNIKAFTITLPKENALSGLVSVLSADRGP